jgi:hypothetical protein
MSSKTQNYYSKLIVSALPIAGIEKTEIALWLQYQYNNK